MSLLSQTFEPFVFMEKTLVPDGFGGYTRRWTEGQTFTATANFQQSGVQTIADQMTERVNCIITTPRSVTLDKFDVIKRVSDGQTFRVLSDGKDTKTPRSATLDMRQSKAELWEVPEDD